MFSVDTEDDAKLLISTACPMDYSGRYYARELAEDQTLENLYAFSDRLAEVWDRIERIRKVKGKS